MKYFRSYFKKYIDIPSPGSYTKEAIMVMKKDFESLGLETHLTKKGGLIGTLRGKDDSKAIALSTHMDTLGGMVKAIRSDGRVKFHRIGGGCWNALEGENCRIFTRTGKIIRGSIVPDVASTHIHGLASYEEKRNGDNMVIRLDECVNSKEDVFELGIQVGDIIAMDTRTEFTETGFIKSRYLDNKAAIAISLTLIEQIKENKIVPENTIHFVISNYEECGHGISYLPDNTHVLIALDIAPVGKDQSSSEYKVTIGAKDKKTPYDYDLITELSEIAKENKIEYTIDVFNHYSSDASQYIHRGGDVIFGCVGFGTDSTHHYERTHIKSIEATTNLLFHYLIS
jgi:putative aminopeptidase FrvX